MTRRRTAARKGTIRLGKRELRPPSSWEVRLSRN
nr:MAG TPA: hypothetical protein [Caudoviricetes sp.]